MAAMGAVDCGRQHWGLLCEAASQQHRYPAQPEAAKASWSRVVTDIGQWPRPRGLESSTTSGLLRAGMAVAERGRGPCVFEVSCSKRGPPREICGGRRDDETMAATLGA